MDALFQTLHEVFVKRTRQECDKAMQGMNRRIESYHREMCELKTCLVQIQRQLRVAPGTPLPRRRTSARDFLTFRKKHKLSQDVFARILGVSRNSLSSWERGRHKPQAENRQALRELKEKSEAEIRALIQQAEAELYQ